MLQVLTQIKLKQQKEQSEIADLVRTSFVWCVVWCLCSFVWCILWSICVLVCYVINKRHN